MRSELELTAWDRLSAGECDQFARRLSDDLPPRFQFAGIMQESCGGIQRYVAHWKVDDEGNERLFALVPGGEVELGFDPKRRLEWTPQQLKDWAKSRAEFDFLGELPEFLETSLTRLRRVSVRPMLIEIQPDQFRTREITEAELRHGLSDLGRPIEESVLKAIRPRRSSSFLRRKQPSGGFLKIMNGGGKGFFITHDNTGFVSALQVEHPPQDFSVLEREIQAEGYCLLSQDEWEHACSGGTRTLFRWGDNCPSNRDPHNSEGCCFLDHSYPENALNAFGLLIAFDPYVTEPCVNPYRHVGGDGGQAMHAGFGRLAAWLSLATSYQGEEPGMFFPLEWVRRAYAIET